MPDNPRYTDEDILRAVAEGKRRAYGEVIVQIHEGRVTRLTVRETRDIKPTAA